MESDKHGIVHVMGNNEAGQLGQCGKLPNGSRKPIRVKLPGSIIKIGAGGMHSMAVSKDGKLWNWGCNDDGALGRETDEEDVPDVVSSLPPVVEISAGDGHSVALTADGDIYICGVFRDDNGKIGLLDSILAKCGSREFVRMDVGNVKFKDICSGNNHVLMLSCDGKVWGVGSSAQCQLGAEFSEPDWTRPRLLSNDIFDGVWCGHYSSMMRLANTSDVVLMGLNNYRQLGFESESKGMLTIRDPTMIKDLWFPTQGPKRETEYISGSDHHTICVTSSGFVYTSGRQDYGRLGTGEGTSHSVWPAIVNSLCQFEISRVSAGIATSYAVTKCGRLFCWGMSDSKTTGFKEDIFEPRELVFGRFSSDQTIARPFSVDVKAGGQHALILSK